jgi:hypothetical protein
MVILVVCSNEKFLAVMSLIGIHTAPLWLQTTVDQLLKYLTIFLECNIISSCDFDIHSTLQSHYGFSQQLMQVKTTSASPTSKPNDDAVGSDWHCYYWNLDLDP